jgi:hypothetical protein
VEVQEDSIIKRESRSKWWTEVRFLMDLESTTVTTKGLKDSRMSELVAEENTMVSLFVFPTLST